MKEPVVVFRKAEREKRMYEIRFERRMVVFIK
jgi:hypothetical protein